MSRKAVYHCNQGGGSTVGGGIYAGIDVECGAEGTGVDVLGNDGIARVREQVGEAEVGWRRGGRGWD